MSNVQLFNSKTVKEKALELGAAQVGIADISCFEGTDARYDPKGILPWAKCVIVALFRVPRALYRAMEQHRNTYLYTNLGVRSIDEDLSEIFLLRMARIIEDHGFDACVQRNVTNLRPKGDTETNPEALATYALDHAVPVAPGKVAPDIMIDFPQAAVYAGLGSKSLRGGLISRKLGPFLRIVCIITDAPLDADTPFEDELCDRCGHCVNACPGKALSLEGGLDSWQCAVYYRGAHKSNPLIPFDFLVDEPEREAILNGDKRFDASSARALFPQLDFLPGHAIKYAPCLCGRACDVACWNHLKEVGVIK
ncbi:MAG: 4Fe-4S binding protein [Christensenellales bacterium]|jgi:epoxyqueuosine reductase QueG